MTAQRTVLFLVGLLALITGIYIFLAPMAFYQTVPGLDLMGPFSEHFIRDIGFAYFSNGSILVCAGALKDKRLAFAGALWLVLHALFHLQIWAHRGFPLDQIFWFEFVAILIPSAGVLWADWGLSGNATAESR